MAHSVGEILVKGDISEFATVMRKLINNQEFSDMKFYVGSDQKPIFAHRCIMSARCAVFKAMLSEAAVIGEKETPFLLTDVSPKIFLTMLEFIYTNCVTLSPDTAIDVLATSLEYGLDDLRDLCVDYLVDNLSAANSCDVMQSAVTYNQNDLKEKAIVFIENNTTDVLKTKGFQEISEDTLVSILRSSKLNIDEMDLCRAVKEWAKVNSANNGKKISEIARDAVNHLRLSLLSPVELKSLEEENKSDGFLPVDLFAYAWKLHALKSRDGDNILSSCRRGTTPREHHSFLAN